MGWTLKIGLVLVLCINAAYADDTTDERMAKLQKMLEEQQWQMKAMAEEIAALQQGRSNDKGKSTGSPVYASFKDGITFEDGGGNWQLAINGRVQADYRNFHPDEDAADTFSLRRARLGGTLTFYKDYVVRVEGEYSATGTSLTYGYFDINKWKQAKLRIGQFKPFYGLERAMSSNFTDFQERSMGDALPGSTYDRGVMVYGTPFTGLNYSVAFINGTGTVDENNAKEDGKDLTVRLTGNVAEMAEWKNAIVHVGGWWAKGDEGSRRLAGFTPTGQSEGRGVVFFSTACTKTNAVGNCGAALPNGFADNVERTRGGAELALAYGPVKLQGEYIHTAFSGPGYDRDINAWYAGTVWNVTGEAFAGMYKDGVFGRLKPKNNLDDNGWGALQLGLRYSKFDASDFKDTNAGGTGVLLNNPAGATDGLLVATNEADAWTLGANWVLTPNTRVMMNYVHTRFETPITVLVNAHKDTLDSENALILRAQFDF